MFRPLTNSKQSLALLVIALSTAEIMGDNPPHASAGQDQNSDTGNVATQTNSVQGVNMILVNNQLPRATNTFVESSLQVQWSPSQTHSSAVSNAGTLSNLRLGSHSDGVSQLQSMLNQQGFQTPINGLFDSHTYRQLVRFQAVNGLEPNGVVSPHTITALQNFQQPPPTPQPEPDISKKILKRGNRGPLVRQVQRLLVYQGFALKIDGFFGAETHQAVMKFQTDQGLRPDGIVGSQTAKVLHSQAKTSQSQ